MDGNLADSREYSNTKATGKPLIQPEITKPGVIVATHPRSGTHLTMDLLRRNFPSLRSKKRFGEPLDSLYVPIDLAVYGKPAERRRVRSLIKRHSIPIVKSHWLKSDFSNLHPDCEDLSRWLNRHAKIVYVVRSPVNTMASHFEFMKSIGKIDASKSDWLLKAGKYWRHHVSSWTSRENVLAIRFEDIINSPEEIIRRVSEHIQLSPKLGDPILPPRLRSVWHGRMLRLFGTDAPSTEILVNRRTEALTNHFTNEEMAAFREIVSPVSLQWGYSSL